MGLSFTQPWALAALLLLVPLTIAAARASRAYLPPARRRTALIVRLLLLPVFLRLAGPAAWYMPRGLDRLLPQINFSHE